MEPHLTQESIQQETAAIRHDLVILSAGVTLLYLGIGCRQDIQRALNDSQALQLTVRGLYLLSRILSCILLPPVFINRLGTKTAFLIAYALHAFYLLTNLDPRFSNLIPGAGILGASNAVLWTAIGVYVTRLAASYVMCRGIVKGQPPEACLVKFLALFFCLLNVAFMVNSLVSSLVLNPLPIGPISEQQISICGADYCNEPLNVHMLCESSKQIPTQLPEALNLEESETNTSILFPLTTSHPNLTNASTATSSIQNGMKSSISPVTLTPIAITESKNENTHTTTTSAPTSTKEPLCDKPLFNPPSPNKVYIVGGLFVGFAVLGFITIGVSLRSLITSQITFDKQNNPVPSSSNGILNQIGETFEVLRDNPPLILLSLVAFCYGHIDNFFMHDFPKSYIQCMVGHHYVGFMTFSIGILASLSAFALLWVHVSFCRLWLILVSTALAYICILSLFVWKPHPDTKGVAYFLSLLWGVVKVLWNIQIFSLCGMLGFPRLAAAFANLLFWWTTGQVISFFWAELICVHHKLYILAVVMAVAVVGSISIELWLRPPTTFSRIAPVKPSMGRGGGGRRASKRPTTHEPSLNTISRTVSSQPAFEQYRAKAATASAASTTIPSAPLPPSPIVSSPPPPPFLTPRNSLPTAEIPSDVLPEEIVSKSLVLRSDMTLERVPSANNNSHY